MCIDTHIRMPATFFLKHQTTHEVLNGHYLKRKPIFHWKITVFDVTRMTSKHVFSLCMEIIACHY